jgi:hypothetical protein
MNYSYHETAHGSQTGPEALEAQNKEAWESYSGLQPTPGWQQSSIDSATAAARAKFALDKAKGYVR